MPKKIIKKSFLLLTILFAAFLLFHFEHGSTALPRQSSGQVATGRTLQPISASVSAIKPSQETPIEKSETKAGQKELFMVSRVEPFSVARVIDGDTIVVNINGSTSSPQAGAETHIRLIGINSPELNDKRAQVACFAKKAKDEAEKLLGGKTVHLEKDPTQGDYDKYGRLLAYVFTEDGSTSSPQGRSFFNKLMIKKEYAYEYTYRLPYKYQNEFRAAQEETHINKKGLWGNDICGR